jgi:hypothetical protein
MNLRVYEVLFQFNQGLDQALTSVDILEKLEVQSAYCFTKVRDGLGELRAYANTHFASKIAQMEDGEKELFGRRRQKREKEEEGPNEIYVELAAREWLRRERGLPPRAVILPWTKADDDRALARLKASRAAPSSQEANSQSASGDSPEAYRKKEEGAQP